MGVYGWSPSEAPAVRPGAMQWSRAGRCVLRHGSNRIVMIARQHLEAQGLFQPVGPFGRSPAVPRMVEARLGRQDDVPDLLLRFDVPGRLDDLLERVAPIDDGPVFASLDELLEEEDVLLRVSRWN